MVADITSRPSVTSPSVIEQAHHAMTLARSEFSKHVKDIQRERHRYSADGFQAEVAAFAKTPVAAAVDEAVSRVQQRAEEAATQVDELRRDISVPHDSVAEMRAGRYWARTRRVLDDAGNGKVVSAVQKLLADADPSERGVLCEELSPYLQSRGLPSGWLEDALGEVVPEYGAARTRLTKAQQARSVVEYNAKMLRKGFTEGRLPATLADPHGYDPDA
jgi:hypothetical protein